MLARLLISLGSHRPAWHSFSWAGGLAIAAFLLLGASATVHAQTANSGKASQHAPEDRPWSSLSASQKNTLRPLEREWNDIDAMRKGKWLEMANRFPSLPAAEQARIQARMEDWAKLTPRERGQARMNFKEAQQVSPQERKARWETYKALPPDQRKQLAARAEPPARKTPATDQSADSSAKSNVVPNSSYAPRPKAIAPTVAQARPGATTNLITKRPSPPAHQQTGLPKIAASPGFVDQSTLLPKRGPQGAAPRPAATASAPAGAPRRRP